MDKRVIAILLIGIAIGGTLVAVFAVSRMPVHGTDKLSQTISENEKEQSGNIPVEQLDLGDVESSYATTKQVSLYAEQNETNKKTVCVFDEYSKKGIKDVGIYVDKIRAGRTTQFGCTDVVIPNYDSKHVISIKGRSLLGSFKNTQTINLITDQRMEFYVDLYTDKDLYTIAYNLVNEYRIKQKLPLFNLGNDLNTQKWAEYMRKNMLADNGMMENARVQIVQTHGYLNERYSADCTKPLKPSDCSQTYYTYSCETPDCTIERGDAVKKIITGILDNKPFRSKEFSYITIGISYDPHAMFLAVNFK